MIFGSNMERRCNRNKLHIIKQIILKSQKRSLNINTAAIKICKTNFISNLRSLAELTDIVNSFQYLQKRSYYIK